MKTSDEALRPCPACGATDCSPANTGGMCRVTCDWCGARGPTHATRGKWLNIQEAEAAWNALPRREDAEHLRDALRAAEKGLECASGVLWRDGANPHARRVDAALERLRKELARLEGTTQ